MNKHLHILLCGVVAAVVTSCSGTRSLPKADLGVMPGAYVAATADSMCVADIDWWEFYTDPALRTIISRTLENNRDLLIAAARVEELRQLYGVDKLNYLPTITGLAQGIRETNDYYAEPYKLDPEYDLKATLNWEIDLWGGLSQARRKSAAQFMASVEQKRAMQITLIAEAATAYFNLVALVNELDIVRRTLATREQALEKSRLRFEGGLTSEIVYQQAKVELATTSSLVPGLERRITLAKNAISLLMGEYPGDDFPALTQHLDERLPERLPVGIPSTLLERRPDLRASEQNLKAALASAGVAYSNRFPSLRISLTGGWENDEFSSLLRSPFSYILGNVTGTIFDFGRNKRKYKAAVAAYEQARLAYERDVMAAFTEVSDAVVTYLRMLETAQRRTELRDAAFKYVDLANKQYIGGTINYIDVLDAHRRYFDAQTSLLNAVRDEYLSIVALYKALGGGWLPANSN